MPARRPKTSRSESELPPEPVGAVHAAGHLAGGEEPGTVAASVSASTRTPPIM